LRDPHRRPTKQAASQGDLNHDVVGGERQAEQTPYVFVAGTKPGWLGELRLQILDTQNRWHRAFASGDPGPPVFFDADA
jgi:hypothetical protein